MRWYVISCKPAPLVGPYVGLTEDIDLEPGFMQGERKMTVRTWQKWRNKSPAGKIMYCGSCSGWEQSTCPPQNLRSHGCVAAPTPIYKYPCTRVGVIPPQLGRLTALKKLDLTGNKLSGEAGKICRSI